MSIGQATCCVQYGSRLTPVTSPKHGLCTSARSPCTDAPTDAPRKYLLRIRPAVTHAFIYAWHQGCHSALAGQLGI